MRFLAIIPIFVLAACSAPTQTGLLDRLAGYCGQAFEGRVTSDDPRDADWAAQTLTIHVRECSPDEVKIPLHVGEDRSRTWIIAQTETGLRLKHDHRHEDGSEDVLTQYGGDTVEPPSASRADFPADQFSKDLFIREDIPDSANNTWSLIMTGDTLTYALNRPGRHFEAVFDLTNPVAPPPPPWGAE